MAIKPVMDAMFERESRALIDANFQELAQRLGDAQKIIIATEAPGDNDGNPDGTIVFYPAS